MLSLAPYLRSRKLPHRQVIFAALIVWFAATNALAQFPATKPQGYVNDLAGVLSPAGKQKLEALSQELDEKAKAQLAVVTVKSLEGRPIEEFAIDLATKWGIGPKGTDRGILLFLAVDDHQDRIEVGYGLEPTITDGRSGGILRAMVPYLRANDFDGALWLGAASLAQPIAQEAGVSLNSLAGAAIPATQPSGGGGNQPNLLVILIPILFLIFFGFIFPRGFGGPGVGRRGGMWGGGPGGFGGWSGGGGGSGGFGGFGGGSFGGGGASGRW